MITKYVIQLHHEFSSSLITLSNFSEIITIFFKSVFEEFFSACISTHFLLIFSISYYYNNFQYIFHRILNGIFSFNISAVFPTVSGIFIKLYSALFIIIKFSVSNFTNCLKNVYQRIALHIKHFLKK